MEQLAGDAHISFEGDLSSFRLSKIPGTSEEETAALKRNTLRPVQEFVVVPLERSLIADILRAIGGAVPRKILHIQIEKHGVLEFGAYDNFSPHCLFFGPAIERVFWSR